MKKVFYYEVGIGKIGIGENGQDNSNAAITDLFFTNRAFTGDWKIEETALIKKTKKQLDQYFAGTREVFDLPLELHGTDFQKAVWNQLLAIPYGDTKTYGEIAKALGKKGASRAVGGANNKNPIGIIIPCHRVIGSNGKLVGYAGGLDIKDKLLALENNKK